jgi:putative transposase
VRQGRLTESRESYYHVMSRVVDRQFVLNDDEKERFRKLLRRVEGFSGVDVMTHSVLGNHFHALLHVPEREDISDTEWIKRVKALYTKPQALDIIDQFTRLREQGHEDAALAYRQRFTDRMYDLAEFVKTLKQRFTQSYNRRHGRKGTLWEERYKSILVEGSANALSTISERWTGPRQPRLRRRQLPPPPSPIRGETANRLVPA